MNAFMLLKQRQGLGMDEGIALLILLVLVVFGGSVAGIIALFQLSVLKKEVALLREKLAEPRPDKPQTDTEFQQHVPRTSSQSTNTASHSTITATIDSLHVEPMLSAARQPQGASHEPILTQEKAAPFEFITSLITVFKTNWLTWVGAIALAFGGIFLARYSLEAGLLSETMRLTLGAVFGVSLIVAAEYLHRKGVVFEGFNNYIPAALASGGFISCFALTLLAYTHYALLAPLPAFAILTLVSLAASWMALRFGPLLAAIGIIGAYSVPVWVNTGSNDFVGLLTYVGFVSVSASLVAHYVKRQWLWYLLWTGHLGWYWLVAVSASHNILWFINVYAVFSILLLIAIVRLGLKFIQIEHRPQRFIKQLKQLPDNPLLIAILAPLGFLMFSNNALLTWQLSSLLMVSVLLFLVLKNSAWDSWLAIAVGCVVLLLISQRNSVDFNEQLFVFRQNYGVGLFFIALFISYGLLFARKYPQRLGFSLIASLSSFVIIGCLYAITPNNALTDAYPLWCTVLLGVSALLFKLAVRSKQPLQVFCFWLGGNGNISLALTMLLEGSSLTLALAMQVVLISFYINKHALRLPMWPLKALIACLLVRLSLAPWTPSYSDAVLLGVHWSIVVYPLCAGLFYWAARFWQQQPLRVWLEGAGLHCIALFVTTETSYQLVGHYPDFNNLSVYEHILLTCNWGVLGCVYLLRARYTQQMVKLYQLAGLGLLTLAGLLAATLFMELNPFFAQIRIGQMPVFNWLLLVWLVPALICVWAGQLTRSINSRLLKPFYILAGAFTALYINAEIRHNWQGEFINLAQPTSDAELYSYSLVWLIIGALVVVMGHLKSLATVQKLGLGLLALVVLKVFLIDMANLTGLLRAVSFIGLGLSLVALSWLFQKFKAKPVALP